MGGDQRGEGDGEVRRREGERQGGGGGGGRLCFVSLSLLHYELTLHCKALFLASPDMAHTSYQ